MRPLVRWMVKVGARERGEECVCGVGVGVVEVGGGRVFSQRRRRSQDSRAGSWEGERGGRGRERVEMLYGIVSYVLSTFLFRG